VRAAYLSLFHDSDHSKLIDWRLRAGGGGMSAVIAEDRGTPRGISTYLSSLMHLGPCSGLAFQAVDSMVAPEARGRGLFTRLAHEFSERQSDLGFDLIWGFPNPNAAPAWFGKLGWTNLGTVPFLVRPLRSSYLFRRLRLRINIPISWLKDHGASQITEFGSDADRIWQSHAASTGCSVTRDAAFLNWRLFERPGSAYRIASFNPKAPKAFVASTTLDKWGGRIGYILEAIGGDGLVDLLQSELGRMREAGTELAFAWCFPHSPNYRAYRKAGFLPLPNRLRPSIIYVGARPYSTAAECATERANWYLSYLDADTL